jgi:hypothetical protein
LIIYKDYTEMHGQKNVKFIGYTVYYRNLKTLCNVRCVYKHTGQYVWGFTNSTSLW